MKLLKSIAFGFGIVIGTSALCTGLALLLRAYTPQILAGILFALATSLAAAHYLATKD